MGTGNRKTSQYSTDHSPFHQSRLHAIGLLLHQEMKRAMERHERGEARVIPIILRPVYWQEQRVPFSKLQALPTNSNPVTLWRDKEKAFFNVAEGIRRAVEELTNRPNQLVQPTAGGMPSDQTPPPLGVEPSLRQFPQPILPTVLVAPTSLSVEPTESAAPANLEPALSTESAPPTKPSVGPQSPSPSLLVPFRKDLWTRRALLTAGAMASVEVLTGTIGGVYILLRRQQPTGTISITFAYSTEKDAWLQDARGAFQSSEEAILGEKMINIQFTAESGSLDLEQQILSGVLPTAWSPASDLEWKRLDYEWRQQHPKGIINSSRDFAPRSLVSSPLIFAIWQNYANVLQQRHIHVDWPGLYDALNLMNGWAGLGRADLGQAIYLGQTLPDQSNSGLLTLILIAYAYAQLKGQDLTFNLVHDPGFSDYLGVFEKKVNGWGKSSGTYLDYIINQSASSHNIIMTYENLVLTRQSEVTIHQHQPLLMFYPSLNILSNHPFIILQGNGVTSEQQIAAQRFRDYLLSDEQQRKAEAYGFRPTSSNVSITDRTIPNNPFNNWSQVSPNRSLNQPFEPSATFPQPNVVEALIQVWKSAYPYVIPVTG